MLQSQIIMVMNIFETLRIAESRETIGQSSRITIIGDRDIYNLEAIIDLANAHPTALQLGGIIVPGYEIDGEIMRLADRVNGMRESGIAFPDGWPIKPADGGNGDWHFSIKTGEERVTISDGETFVVPRVEDLFHYLHVPYDAARLRSDEDYRREYCEGLLEKIKITNPDFIFLANFKLFLHPVVVEAYEGRIINVHPSVLPLLKGFRPESRADSGETPQALGYTIHVADTDLDGGPTLFQQKVLPIEPYDVEKERRLGKKLYNQTREETLRLKIIKAQAKYSADVLALYASSAQRKIMEGQEAFASEGRPGFESPDPKPYRRILFDVGNGWQTAEAILGASEYAEVATPHTLTRYHVKIYGGNRRAFMRWGRLLTKVQILAGEGRGEPSHTRVFYDTVRGEKGRIRRLLHGSFLASVDAAALLAASGIKFTTEELPTRVTAPRKPPLWLREEDQF